MPNEFNILTHPLRLGTQSLIEAGAGTGKTTALENLVLRLLIDGVTLPDGGSRQLAISEILLVTFTEAATAELIQRVRNSISRALAILKNGDFGEDICSKILRNSCVPEDEIKASLHMALLSFDENAISTIHGFCQKMLSNFAFESNSRFNLELITDERPFLEELVNDYWRENFYRIDSGLEKNVLKSYGWNPGILHALLRNIQRAPLTEIAAPEGFNIDTLQDACAGFKAYCRGSKEFYIFKERTGNFIGRFTDKLTDAFNCFLAFGDIFELVKLLKRDRLENNLRVKASWDGLNDLAPGKKKLPSDFDGLLTRAEEVERCVQVYFAGLKYKFIDYVKRSGILKQKKLTEGVLSFDDLLLDMYEAVTKSDDFRKLIRRDFPVVMLDEFQDTDPLQFRIFDRTFRHGDAMLLMVGDPKQSVYQFRGADIFSYLQVSEKLAGKKNTLTTNYRSDESLLKGINTIFDLENPFVEKAISFIPAVSGKKARKLIIRDGNGRQPLKIMNSRDIGKGVALKLFIKAVCAEIVKLLQSDEAGNPQAYFENEDGSRVPLRANDIAVLTARNSDALAMYEQLAGAGVQATLQQSGNVFESDEAVELLLLFNAIIQPGDAVRVKSVLATGLFRLNASALEELDNNGSEMEAWQEMFFELLRKWQEEGFIQMFFRLLRSPKVNVKANLLTLPQGERRLTNLLHLTELLHRESARRNLSPTALIYWLHQRISNPGDEEEHELRLESDDSAVKIMTVHKSKGLQFPVVFCLNLWQREFISKYEEENFFYHDEEYRQHFEINPSGDNFARNRLCCRKETLGELVRLTYVALTRAENRCCFTCGPRTAGSLEYLTACPAEDELDAFLLSGGKTATRREWRTDDNIEVVEVSENDFAEEPEFTGNIGEPEWKTLPVLRPVPNDWGIMSFSAITAGSHQDAEFRPGDDDEAGENEIVPEDNIDLFSQTLPLGDFPRGPVAGNCIHALFEKFDFAVVKDPDWREDPAIGQMLKEQLFISGMLTGVKGSREFAESENLRCGQIYAMLENVFTYPFPGSDGIFRLCDLPRECRCPEMQFFFPAVKILDSLKMNELIRRLSGYESALPPVPLRGIVNGFIDLVFETGGRYYIIDWKSNDLGAALSDYNRENMAASMRASYYYLQAAIYLLALHKYLQKRFPAYDFEKHIGGIFYVYVRGVKSDLPDTGVYNIRPELKTVELLGNIFESE
ncbi:MAG: exodeoxyribonuclease V subunit beta [Victivallaceae bacterium]|nr:exodeoxyribonuclease V subunit beta [Victivallaceae bacterium]